jgi:hypothetical protein
MTTIRPARRAEPEFDTPAAEAAATGQHLPPAPLRSARLSVSSVIGLGCAAAALAALAVFGLDSMSGPSREPTSTAVEATPKGPAATGSFASPPVQSRSTAPASPSASSAATKAERGPERVPPATAERTETAAATALPPAAPAPPLQMAAAPPAPAPPVVQFAPMMPQVESRAAPPPLVTLSAAEVAAHLAQGEDKLKVGEVAAARLYFERVALSGDARGALGMARTYDAAVLATLPVIGPQPDAGAARTWRERARSLRAGP